MKTLIAVFLLGALVCSAQTNQTFTTLKVADKTYTNCTVKVLNPAEGIVLFAGGGAKIKLADLPPETQKLFQYDPVAAQEFLAKKKQSDETKAAQLKAQQVAAQQLDAAISEPEKLRIVEVAKSYGYHKCVVSGKGGRREILLSAVPSWLTKIISEIDQANGAIRKAEQTINAPPTFQTAPKTIKRSKSGKVTVNNAKYSTDKTAVTDAKKVLSEAKAKLKDLKSELTKTDFFAAKTGKTYAGLSIWKCVAE